MNKKVSKSKIALCIAGVIGCIFFAAFLFIKSPLFEVSFVTPEAHLELGHRMEEDPAFYLEGPDWVVALSKVDTSSVKKDQMGRYPVSIQHGFETYTCYVNVTDTTPPKVSCNIKNFTITPGEILSVHSLGLNISDYSEIDTIAFTKISSTNFYTGLPEDQIADMREAYKKGLTMWAEEFQFSFGGIYTLTIEVEDIYSNSSEITLNLTVEQPPVFDVPNHFYVAIGNPIDFSKYVDAWDFIDTHLTAEDIIVDSSQLNNGMPGVYPVYFTMKDSYGLSSTAVTQVHIYTRADLQEKINNHELSVEKDIIIGAYNPYDIGVYKDASSKEIQNIMLPTLACIINEDEQLRGSGFILSIDDAFVTLATNYHVISGEMTPKVVFYDGTTCKGSVVASNAREDIAFIRIPIDGANTNTSLPSSFVKTLRTVHVNEGYWKNISPEDSITVCFNCIDENGNVWYNSSGKLKDKLITEDLEGYKDVRQCILTNQPVEGCSGSAVFDRKGNLIAMIRGQYIYDTYTESVAVPLSELLDYYEVIFKKKLQYQ